MCLVGVMTFDLKFDLFSGHLCISYMVLLVWVYGCMGATGCWILFISHVLMLPLDNFVTVHPDDVIMAIFECNDLKKV